MSEESKLETLKDEYYKQMYDTPQSKEDFQDKPGPKGLVISELTWVLFSVEDHLNLHIVYVWIWFSFNNWRNRILEPFDPERNHFSRLQDKWEIKGNRLPPIHLSFSSSSIKRNDRKDVPTNSILSNLTNTREIHDKRPRVVLHDEMKSGNPFKSAMGDRNQSNGQMTKDKMTTGQDLNVNSQTGPTRSLSQFDQQMPGYRPYPSRGGYHQR